MEGVDDTHEMGVRRETRHYARLAECVAHIREGATRDAFDCQLRPVRSPSYEADRAMGPGTDTSDELVLMRTLSHTVRPLQSQFLQATVACFPPREPHNPAAQRQNEEEKK